MTNIGIPKEIMENEHRVGATPAMVKVLKDAKHNVFIQSGAGSQIGFLDSQYEAAGATLVNTPEEVYAQEMVVKVKEPIPQEYHLLHENQVLFCYLHLAPTPSLTKELLERKVVAIAYETVTDHYGNLPLLIPMSEIAGRVAIQVGASLLQLNHGGKGVLLGGVPGVYPGHVLILGGGIVGVEAARMALGLGAKVTIIDHNLYRLRELDRDYGPKLITLYANSQIIEENIEYADLVIGAVLIPGKLTPKLVSKDMVKKMSPGSVIVDVSIDQGGCFETSRPTTHGNPTYLVDGVIHYCVTNIPGACARTATLALTNATLKPLLQLANKGYRLAMLEDEGLRHGLNVCKGKITNSSVAIDLGDEYTPPENIL